MMVIEDPGVEDLELRVKPGASSVFLDQLRIGKGPLWIAVESLQVRPCWRAVQVEVHLLDILPVVAFVVGQPEEPLLEYRILLVPQRGGEAEEAMPIAQPEETVFAPAVRPTAGMVVGEIRPT